MHVIIKSKIELEKCWSWQLYERCSCYHGWDVDKWAYYYISKRWRRGKYCCSRKATDLQWNLLEFTGFYWNLLEQCSIVWSSSNLTGRHGIMVGWKIGLNKSHFLLAYMRQQLVPATAQAVWLFWKCKKGVHCVKGPCSLKQCGGKKRENLLFCCLRSDCRKYIFLSGFFYEVSQM